MHMPATTGHQAESAPGQPPTLDLNFVSQALIGFAAHPGQSGQMTLVSELQVALAAPSEFREELAAPSLPPLSGGHT